MNSRFELALPNLWSCYLIPDVWDIDRDVPGFQLFDAKIC